MHQKSAAALTFLTSHLTNKVQTILNEITLCDRKTKIGSSLQEVRVVRGDNIKRK